MPAEAPGPLRTVDRCLRLLGLFTPEAPAWTPSAAAQALGIPRSVAHRLLATLAARGFLAQDGARGRYRPGLRLIALGMLAQRVHGFEVVRPLLRELARATGQSVFVTTLDGDSAVTVEKVEAEGGSIRLTLEVGARSPLHAGASQRVLLAHLPPQRREAYLAQPLEKCTPATLTEPGALRRTLDAIRARGYDFTVGELTPEVAALAVPLLAPGDLAVASLSVAGPAERLPAAAIPRLLPAVHATARAIEAHLRDR
jgi:DNA-binding IclR family transcriptional regulator